MKYCPNCFSKNLQNHICPVCGFQDQRKRNSRAIPVGIKLHGRYILGRVLGVGGFGITYVAYDTWTQNRVAIKEYFPSEWAMRTTSDYQIIPNSQNVHALYRHGQDVFINEARLLSRFKSVDNIVNILDFFPENGTAYMVMELLDGYTLTGYLKTTVQKRMEYQTANEITKVVGLTLHKVHDEMLLHRDVGPDNIMMTKNGKIYLIDFGATRMYALNSPNGMSVLVKPGFAPIEQYSRAGNQGPWTDVYALAATYYFLVTGKKPPQAPDRIAGEPLIPISNWTPQVPGYINEAVTHALSEEWRERPQSMYDFLMEMRLVDSTYPVPRTVWGWTGKKIDNENRIASLQGRTKRPCVLMQVGNQRTRYYFTEDFTLSIGRSSQEVNIVLNDNQVSGIHCKLWYDTGGNRFMVQNFSANRTYTSQKVLDLQQGVYLMRGEWIYIQTDRERYIFYLEVE